MTLSQREQTRFSSVLTATIRDTSQSFPSDQRLREDWALIEASPALLKTRAEEKLPYLLGRPATYSPDRDGVGDLQLVVLCILKLVEARAPGAMSGFEIRPTAGGPLLELDFEKGVPFIVIQNSRVDLFELGIDYAVKNTGIGSLHTLEGTTNASSDPVSRYTASQPFKYHCEEILHNLSRALQSNFEGEFHHKHMEGYLGRTKLKSKSFKMELKQVAKPNIPPYEVSFPPRDVKSNPVAYQAWLQRKNNRRLPDYDSFVKLQVAVDNLAEKRLLQQIAKAYRQTGTYDSEKDKQAKILLEEARQNYKRGPLFHYDITERAPGSPGSRSVQNLASLALHQAGLQALEAQKAFQRKGK
jgi:hypothetical protein